MGLSLPGWWPENTEILSFLACGSTETHLAASKCFSTTLKLHQGFHMALVLPGCLFRDWRSAGFFDFVQSLEQFYAFSSSKY